MTSKTIQSTTQTVKKPSPNKTPTAIAAQSSVLLSELPASNLETYLLLWLDADVNKTAHNIETAVQFRSINRHFLTFDRIDECEKHIRQAKDEKVILIVSGAYGSDIVPRLQDLTQLNDVYVYCGDKAHKRWADNYPKVRGVYIDSRILMIDLLEDHKIRHKINDTITISIFSRDDASNISRDRQSHIAMFMWLQLFVEVLCRMHHKSDAKEFEDEYDPEKAIWWYTRESCLYRLLNKALREQDFDIIFSLRVLISDLAKQLKKEHNRLIRTSNNNQPVLRIYRGQAISTAELNLMKSNAEQFITMNNFLSTTFSRKTAVKFAKQVTVNNDVERILFEMEADTRLLTKPFANIEHLSYYEEENEVLIMLGSIFRITELYYNERNNIWIAKLILCSEEDYDLKEIFS
ncbi:unnamed protein product, partial [Didymodactylos carnosus]